MPQIVTPTKRLVVNLPVQHPDGSVTEEQVAAGSRLVVDFTEGDAVNHGKATHMECTLGAVRGGPPTDNPIEVYFTHIVRKNLGFNRPEDPDWYPREWIKHVTIRARPRIEIPPKETA